MARARPALIEREFCAYFQEAAELLGRRWAGAVVRALLSGPLRFSELERVLPGVSARALAQRLRELEEADVVRRDVDAGPPVRVGYELTERGRELEPAVDALERWAHRWLER